MGKPSATTDCSLWPRTPPTPLDSRVERSGHQPRRANRTFLRLVQRSQGEAFQGEGPVWENTRPRACQGRHNRSKALTPGHYLRGFMDFCPQPAELNQAAKTHRDPEDMHSANDARTNELAGRSWTRLVTDATLESGVAAQALRFVPRHSRGRRARSDHLHPWFRRCGDGAGLVHRATPRCEVAIRAARNVRSRGRRAAAARPLPSRSRTGRDADGSSGRGQARRRPSRRAVQQRRAQLVP